MSALRLVTMLVVRDFKSRFQASLFGIFWAILQPVAMMLILWFVFTYGLKAQPHEGQTPFVVWFFTASIAWNFFVDAFASGTNSILEYSFLVKKIAFPVIYLPLIKILSATILHLIFIAVVSIILTANSFFPSWYWIQIIYYLLAMQILLYGITLVSSSLNVFSRDISQIVNIFLQFGFWATPIIWELSRIPDHLQKYFYLNPVFYVTEGYRNTLLSKAWLWEIPLWQHLSFWFVTLFLCLIGTKTFRKLKPHFADVI